MRHPFRFGVVAAYAPSHTAWITTARRIEELGYSTLLMPDRTTIDSLAPLPALAVAAQATTSLRVGTYVLCNEYRHPVLLAREAATLDLLSGGRAEIVAGRGSFVEAYPLFGLDIDDYDALFTEKLDLLLKIRDSVSVRWSGKHRAALTGQSVYPRPLQKQLPIWVGVGGTPASFVRAGTLGLPLMVAIIGGDPRQFTPLIELYRAAGARAGWVPWRVAPDGAGEPWCACGGPPWPNGVEGRGMARGSRRAARAMFSAAGAPDRGSASVRNSTDFGTL